MARQKQTLSASDSGGKWRSWMAEHRSLLFLLVIGSMVRIWNISWGLPQLYEEAIPLRFGMKFWDLTKNPIDYHFFVYPSFTYFVHFIFQASHFIVGYAFGLYAGRDEFFKAYLADPTTFAIISRVVTAIFDVATIVVAYKFLLAFADKRTALVAAFFLSINPLHVSESHLINVDTPFTFFCVLALFYFYKFYTQPSRTSYILAGIAVGLATATKYHGLVLVGSLTCVHLFKSKTLTEAIRSLKDRSLIYALAISGIVFLVFNPFILTHLDDFMMKLRFNELHMEAGHLGIESNTSTLGFYFLQSLPRQMGLVFVVFSTGSMIYLLVSRERKNWILLSIPLFLLILLGSWKMRADRYILPIVPFMIICGSIALVRLWDQSLQSGFLRKLSGFSNPGRVFTGCTLVLVISIPMIAGLVGYHHSVMLPDTRTIAKSWIEHNLATGSALATGPFGVELPDTGYLLMPIQFSAVNSEQMAPLYDTRWYEDLDLLIASDFDYGRYKQDPVQYRNLLRFYDTLRTSWKLVREIAPSDSQAGPTIWLYRFDGRTPAEIFDTNLIKGVTSSGLEDSRKVDFLGKLGLILNVKGKPYKSAQVLMAVLRIDPANTIAKSVLAGLSRRLNSQIQAQSSETTSIRQEGERVSLLLRDADELFNSNDLEGAERKYFAVLAIDKGNDSAYVQLVTIYALGDDRAKVIAILSRYLQAIPPDDPRHALVKEQLRKVRSMKD